MMISVSFRCVTAIFVSPGPTPAIWPKGGTLSSTGGPCLSPASWPAFLGFASIRSHKARWGVTGFGSFCLHNKGRALRDASCKTSAAGPKPGIIEKHVNTRIGGISSPDKICSWPNTKRDIQFTSQNYETRIINFL
jgi:hypothetical protein